ncbi:MULTISPECIES: mechanosensitive ion channel family protein [Pseudonocardia]|uniref:MscS Mechanosensitive ion channel n=1 Tax=Pseudonocardia dioxanivorans (strain ATCC 55486 / DSM 44775 / JCM 13855 / CB1190) TaxID=675635 RepID=F4D1N4_PSEUX|nr:mechanosensitive ion channel family protein [Pseudonocardia dioxanivorans]AEA26946.1 MscS Mechanosensitive ion channel [Pseudonocardia dioxanivorans CB1190]GJF01864.1 mechanosensitive ion channel protein MscS [Pseudonocardia sp. D17]
MTATAALAEGLLPDQPICAADPGTWCARFYQWTHSDFLAASADVIVSKTFSILLIVLVALLSRWLLHRAIRRLIDNAVDNRFSRAIARRSPRRQRNGSVEAVTARRSQRAKTIGSVLRSITSAVVLLIASIMILAEFNVALGPILASAGIVGVAVGFGAQNLVRDFLSGMFMLLEDQYGVGDVVDVGDAVGTVETVGLRITTIRDVKGTLWYVRNGEIVRVGNMTQGYAVAVVDLPLAHTADTDEVTELVTRVSTERLAQDDVKDDVLQPVQVLGVDKVTAEGMVLRLTAKVSPGRQFVVQRALNAAITSALDDAKIPRPVVYPAAADTSKAAISGPGGGTT